MISCIVYSHSEYDDCWLPFFDRFKRHCSFEFDKYYLFSDDTNEKADKRFQHIAYNNEDAYTNRLLSCLEHIDTEYCLFQHEDMILYDDIHKEYFQECVDYIEGRGLTRTDYIKLHKSGSPRDLSPQNCWRIKESDILKTSLVSFDYMFSIQPSLWKTKVFRELVENNQNLNIWKLETRGQSYCKETLMSSLYTQHHTDQRRGMFHWDSIVWPYIATAILKGKWCTNEYPIELGTMFREYGIDPNIRGEL